MKGWVFLISDSEENTARAAFEQAISDGCFVPILPVYKRGPKKGQYLERVLYATLADLATVRANDLVFFFFKRRIYGVGRVIGSDNAPCASFRTDASDPAKPPRDDEVICPTIVFDPHPAWMDDGLDMDDLLMSAAGDALPGIRMMAGKSFFQLETDEAIWLRNQFLSSPTAATSRQLAVPSELAGRIRQSLARRELGPLDAAFVIRKRHVARAVGRGDARKTILGAEDVLHHALIDLIQSAVGGAGPPVGRDLLAIFHEFRASPVKPAEYADAIDVLAVARPTGEETRMLPVFYDVWEMKKDKLSTMDAFLPVLRQGMKYVDFICGTRAARNYGRVRLNIVASKLPDSVESMLSEMIKYKRNYIESTRGGQLNQETWEDLRLFEYSVSTGEALQLVNVSERLLARTAH